MLEQGHSQGQKRGRPPSFPVEIVRRLFSLYKDAVVVDGIVVSKKNEIWQKISTAVNAEPTVKTYVSAMHLYLAVTENRYKLHDVLHLSDTFAESCGSIVNEEYDVDNNCSSQSENSEESSEQSSVDLADEEASVGVLNFVFKLSRREWHDIKPEEVHYKDRARKSGQRSYLVLKRKVWTHIINDHFWRATKLPCKLSYHGGRLITSQSAHAITIYGTCTYCKSRFKAFVDKLPEEDETVHFEGSYRGKFSVPHPKGLKRNLAGATLQRALRKLKEENIAPSAFQKMAADKIMSFGDPEPAHLPSSSQLRGAKSKALRKTRIDDNPIVALGKAMHESRFQNIIRDVSYDKFQVRYHSPAQIHVYRQYSKENFPISVSIDATGKVVNKLKKAPGIKSGPIFLYSQVVRDKVTNKIYPLCNLLSERHDTETIRHWLAMFLRCNVPPPQEVVVDMSMALMSASVQAYTSLPSPEEYTERCAQLLNLIPTPLSLPQKKPECFIRNDVAHLVKMMTSWSSFRGQARITRQFFVRSMCQVLQCTDLQEVRTLLKHIITVAASETEGIDINMVETPCEESKNYLIQKIGGLVVPQCELTDLEKINEPDLTHHTFIRGKQKVSDNTFYQMVCTIKEDVFKNAVVGNRGNQQHLPSIVTHILKIAPLIPFWTSVMVPIFGYGGITASSAPVEADFNILKNILFKHHTLPMRVDDFVFNHISAIEGAMKIAGTQNYDDGLLDVLSDFDLSDSEKDDLNGAYSRNSKETKINHDLTVYDSSIDINNSDIEEANLEDVVQETTLQELDKEKKKLTQLNSRIKESKKKEDWGGLESCNSRISKRKHKSYLQTNSEMTRVDLSRTRPVLPIGVIRNGNISSLKPLDIDSEKVILSNTCAFDSMVQLFCVAYCDSDEFKTAIHSTNNAFLKLVREMICNGVNRKIYFSRAQILTSVCKAKNSLPGGLRQVQCETGVSALAPLILEDYPSVLERSVCVSDRCSRKEKLKGRVPLSVSLNTALDLNILEHLVEAEICSRKTNCLEILKNMKKKKLYCQGSRRLTKDLSNYLLIEPIQIKDNEARLLQCILNVRDIPTKMSVGGNIYNLRGCVGFLGTDKTTDLGHYVAYVRRHDGSWETYNDLKDKKDSCATRMSVRCHLMLFTI